MVDKRESYSKEDLVASGRGELFGENGPPLPSGNMLMMDRVVKMTEDGGKYDMLGERPRHEGRAVTVR